MSACRKPSSVTTSTSPSWKGNDPVEEAKDAVEESNDTSFSDIRELVESRLTTGGAWVGLGNGIAV